MFLDSLTVDDIDGEAEGGGGGGGRNHPTT